MRTNKKITKRNNFPRISPQNIRKIRKREIDARTPPTPEDFRSIKRNHVATETRKNTKNQKSTKSPSDPHP